MDTRFTPGPWFVQPGFLTVYSLSAGTHGATKAIAKDCGQCDTDEEVEANAHLIAAAPCMAEFVRKHAESGDPEAQGLWERINASDHAKARGENQ